MTKKAREGSSGNEATISRGERIMVRVPGSPALMRRATADDVSSVLALIREVVPMMRESGNLQWDSAYPNRQVFERDVAAGRLWVASVDGCVAGVAAVTSDQEPEYAQVGWDLSEQAIVIHRLAVHPEFRGRGIAEALMREAEHEARRRRIAVLRVDTNTRNEATQRLFPKLGYVLAGEIALNLRPGLRFRCYEKRLTLGDEG